jgi:ABC-type nickel/cobalt efflux system permease component RcnA
MDLITLLGGALLLSFLHGLIPSHWVPFVVLGRDRRWARGRIVFATLLGGVAHLSSTVMIGVMIGALGYALSQSYEATMRWVGPVILIGIGGWIFWRGHSCHHPHHAGEHSAGGDHDHDHQPAANGTCTCGHDRFDGHDIAALGALCAMMFFSPCLELEFYYLVAVRRGWLGIASVSVVYMIVTVGVMMAMVALAAKGLEELRWAFLTRHERRLSGGLLVLLGLVWVIYPF